MKALERGDLATQRGAILQERRVIEAHAELIALLKRRIGVRGKRRN